MSARARTLAVITARGGSKGLPGKNVRPLAGVPLIAHSVLLAKMCPEIDRCVVSTDSEEIAEAARAYGADVPFMRPAELAQSDSPIWPVLRHALEQVESAGPTRYRYLVLLDPTSPTRLPEDVAEAVRRLEAEPSADGIVSVSLEESNPIWHAVIDKDGWMRDLFDDGVKYERRQDVPDVFQINGLLYAWRTSFARRRAQSSHWRRDARLLMLKTPPGRSVSVDTLDQFRRLEVLVERGLLKLPWLDAERA